MCGHGAEDGGDKSLNYRVNLEEQLSVTCIQSSWYGDSIPWNADMSVTYQKWFHWSISKWKPIYKWDIRLPVLRRQKSRKIYNI